ncbi:MAG: hypothetical protein ACXWV9_11770, partial [Flavisolibacter sp.]
MKYLLFLMIIGIASCESGPREDLAVMGYAPVYFTSQGATDISNEAIRATTHPGKIYAYGIYLFQVEQNEGIHIIDNSNQQQVKKISFLKIPGCSEIAIRNNYLYSNNLNDLVVFDLSNLSSPQLVNRLENAFPQFSQSYPPFSGVYFECPDPSKGVVIAWEQKSLSSAKCR